jgi:[protein-PII] uridylyltransferase
MTSYFQRARAALRNLVHAGRVDPAAGPAPASTRADHVAPVPLGGNLALTAGTIVFVDPARAAVEPASWLGAFEAAVANSASMSSDALAIITEHVNRYPADAFFSGNGGSHRLAEFLRPHPGLAERLAEMRDCRLLGKVLPELRANQHALVAIKTLERLLEQPATLSGERFGVMLGEINAPELLVLSLLAHGEGQAANQDNGDEDVRAADRALDRLQLSGEARPTAEFLVRNRLHMAQLTTRGDTSDPDVVGRFAEFVGTEERLKMLCLMTIAELNATSPDGVTPWKEELLWRLFVDAYNHMTMAYGDEVIDQSEATLAALQETRPDDIFKDELSKFLEGLPRRYLTLFDADSIYQHVRLWRDMSPDAVHFFLKKKPDAWELAVVTLDKPYLFSNICGVLAFFGMDILRGYALTSLGSLVVDVFQFADRDSFFASGPDARSQFDALVADVGAGRVDITARLKDKARAHESLRTAPVIYFDNDSSQRYTVLEVLTDDVPGLLHRLSRVISRHGCAVDLVLISTEGHKAVDVFHMRKGTSKLTDSDQLALTEDLERMLEEG